MSHGDADAPPVRAVMVRHVFTVGPDQPVDAALHQIATHRITGVPVVDQERRCIGIVSESDLLTKRGTTVRQVMTEGAVSITDDRSLAEAADLLLGHRIRRLAVVDGQLRLVGILTRMDLLRHLARTHWECRGCGRRERGLGAPGSCPGCAATNWRYSVDA